MSRFSVLKKIILKHKYRLILTYTLFSIEMLGLLLRPFFLGRAVDDLLEGSYKGLIYLAVSHLVWLVAGTIRHMYDTRTYSSIYTTLVTGMLSRKYHSAEVSKLSAHSTLAREFIDFLEFDLNYVVEAAYSLIGSLIMLLFYEKIVVLLCLIVLIPVLIISYYYGKKMKRLNKMKNDELENQVGIIATRNVKKINQHYANLRKWQVKISDKEAWNFGVMELLVLCVIVVSLLISTSKSWDEGFLAGDIIGIYNYILKFVGGLDTIPYTVQRFSSLKDITRRIEVEGEYFNGMAPK